MQSVPRRYYGDGGDAIVMAASVAHNDIDKASVQRPPSPEPMPREEGPAAAGRSFFVDEAVIAG
jgi:hypothetical protein